MSVKVYFGVPGSGKTTLAASIAKMYHRKKVKVFSNFPCKYTYLFDASDLGFFDMSNSVILLDECSIDFNNRKWKTLPQETIKFLKLYRHYGIKEIYLFSQSYDDMDVTLKRLATEYYLVRKLGLGFIQVKQAVKVLTIDKETHQFIDAYRWRVALPKLKFGPLYWSYFDSWSAPALPGKSFPYNPGKIKSNRFVTSNL